MLHQEPGNGSNTAMEKAANVDTMAMMSITSDRASLRVLCREIALVVVESILENDGVPPRGLQSELLEVCIYMS